MGRQDMGSSQVIPPPPPGFKMVDDSAIPPPPPGFKLQGEAPSTTPQESAQEPGFFEPHQEGWSPAGIGRGALASTVGAIMHPIETLKGIGQGVIASGMSPGGYPTIAPTGNRERDLGNIQRQEQAGAEALESGNTMRSKDPGYMVGGAVAPIAVGMGAKAVGPAIGRAASTVGRNLVENSPTIGKGAGAIGGYGLAHWPGLIAGRYLGEAAGNLIKKATGGPEPPAIVGKMKPGRVAGPQGQPSPIPSPEPAPVTGKIQPVGEPEGAARIPSIPRSKPPDVFEPPVRSEQPVPPPTEPSTVSLADQNATARSLGFRNAQQAIDAHGQVAWNRMMGTEPQPMHAPAIPAPAHEAPIAPVISHQPTFSEAPKPVPAEGPGIKQPLVAPPGRGTPQALEDIADEERAREAAQREEDEYWREKQYGGIMPTLSKSQLVGQGQVPTTASMIDYEARQTPLRTNEKGQVLPGEQPKRNLQNKARRERGK